MNKAEAVLRYKTSMTVFKKWAAVGVFSGTDVSTMEAILAEKCGLSSSSIYREHDLISGAKRANIASGNGGIYGTSSNDN